MSNDVSSNGSRINPFILSLGTRIRMLRNARNMKIAELSEMTGLTSGTISQVERGVISPSIASLKKICDVLGIPVGLLFEDPMERSSNTSSNHVQSIENYLKTNIPVNTTGQFSIVHKEARKILMPGEGIRFYLLNPDLSGPIEMIYNEYDPGSSTGSTLYSHPGTECGVILFGELTIQLNDEIRVLKEGDSITFQSSIPHLKKNDSNVMCTCIWANVPPWF